MYVKNNILYFEPSDYLRKKKISARSLVELVGLNNFKKAGDAILSIYSVVKEDVDPKWLRRGEFAERIVKAVYERDGHKCVTYNPQEIKYDCFPEDPFFGGIIDIDLPEEDTLIEVKSKDLKSYDMIDKNPPKHEVYQGMFYAYKRHYHRFKVIWVFFDPETQEEIFQGKKPTTLKNIKKLEKDFRVDFDEMSSILDKARDIINNFAVKKCIPISDISPELFEKLKPRINRYE